MAYAKINVEAALASGRFATVKEVADAAVADHIRSNGCAFEECAADRAIERAGLPPDAPTSILGEAEVAALGGALEALETDCPHKAPRAGSSNGS